MKRHYVYLLLLAAATVSGTGCSSGLGLSSPYSGGPREMVSSKWRDHVWANRAYETRFAETDADVAFESDYRRGFVAGYQSVSQGGDGTLPAMPPRRYWGSHYLSPEGQAKAKAWFEGYPVGVRAAQEDGIDAYRDIYVNQLLDDINKQGPGMKPEMGRHMLDMPEDERLAPPSQPEWIESNNNPPIPESYNIPASYVEEGSEMVANPANLPIPLHQAGFAALQPVPKTQTTYEVPVLKPGQLGARAAR